MTQVDPRVLDFSVPEQGTHDEQVSFGLLPRFCGGGVSEIVKASVPDFGQLDDSIPASPQVPLIKSATVVDLKQGSS